MHIAIGSDHAGFRLKEQLIEHLRAVGHKVEDKGTFNEASTDYPDYAHAVARDIAEEKEELGITLVSDPDKSVMKQYGAFGEKKLYGKTVEGVIRSTVVVDEDGKVFLAQYNVKATGHVAKLRKDLKLNLADEEPR